MPDGEGRALILADIEGIVGVDDWRDILGTGEGYPAACRDYARDVNSAVRGLRAAGAAEVLVVDTHAAGTNLTPEALEGCRLIQDPSILARIETAFAAGVDALVLLGFHAAAGTPDGFVPHSFAVQTRSWLNDNLAGEPAFYALLAGSRRVPTVLITGDRQTIEQVRPFAPGAVGVETKASLSPWRATSFDAASTRAEIESAASAAYRARAGVPPSALEVPIELKVETQTEVAARLVAGVPGMTRTEGQTAVFRGEWPEVWRAFVTANSLAALAATAGGSWYHGPLPGSLVERLREVAGAEAQGQIGAYYAAQFSPPWGPACPPEAMP
ncbi:MAG: M55 family metallopeptidase [Chloroflexota bacterium]|nr:M55 family metallopeptidase [Chloroflexota bacterium]